jgi:hypothetical protein
MKSLTILFLFFASCCFAQHISDSSIDKAYDHIWRGDSSDLVIKTCRAYLHQIGDLKKKLKAVYCEGMAYMRMKNYDSAMVCCKASLLFPAVNFENTYQNESARDIAEIFIGRKQYDSAIHYLNMAEKKYDYLSFGFMENYIYYTWDMSMYYAECYKGKGEYQKAINELAPQMMNSIFTSSNNSWLMDSLYSLYLLVYSKDAVRNEFVNAIKTIKLQVKKSKGDPSPYVYSYVTLFKKKIMFDQGGSIIYALTNKPDTITRADLKQESIEAFKDTYIYKLATQ